MVMCALLISTLDKILLFVKTFVQTEHVCTGKVVNWALFIGGVKLSGDTGNKYEGYSTFFMP